MKEEENEKIEEKKEEEIPTFTAPKDEGNEEIPTFTAPKGGDDDVPTFTAPKGPGIDGKYCHHHPSKPAAGKCNKCGKYICKDCLETCAVTINGQAYNLCFDCCNNIFKEDEKKFAKDKRTIMFHYVLTIIGMVIGGIFGIGGGILGLLIGAVIGGSFLAAFKPVMQSFVEFIKGIFELASGNILEGIFKFIGGFFQFLIVAIQCAFRTTKKMIIYTRYLISTNNALKETRTALKQIKDFMDYMNYMENNPKADVSKLVAEGGALAGNSYAVLFAEKGEKAADEALRHATTIIAENGEIIRKFDVNAA